MSLESLSLQLRNSYQSLICSHILMGLEAPFNHFRGEKFSRLEEKSKKNLPF